MYKRLTCFVALVAFVGLLHGGAAYGFDPLGDPALVGWWSFNEGTGAVAADSSANGNDGTLTGGATWAPGRFGSGIELDGSTGYVSIPSFSLPTDTVTMVAWLNGWKANDWAAVVTGQPARLELGFGDNDTLHYTWNNDSSATWSWTGGPTIPQDEWAMLAVSLDPSQATVYVYTDTGGLAQATNGISHVQQTFNQLQVGWSFGNRYIRGIIDEVAVYSRALTEEEILVLTKGPTNPAVAAAPSPSDGATDVPREVILGWEAGEFAATHDVYLGTVFDDVNDAGPGSPLLVSSGQAATTYDPPGRLEFNTTYYWRVDEVNAPPTQSTVYQGGVWSFTTEPVAYPVANVVATSAAPNDVGRGPNKLVDGAGLNAAEQHSNNEAEMWVASIPAGDSAVLQFDFDRVYKLQKAQIWNFNHLYEIALRFSVKDVTVEYATEPGAWTVLGDFQLGQGNGRNDYAGEPIDFGGVAAQSVRITANSNYGGQKFGMAEVRFYYIPAHAREPMPADGATGVGLDPVLSWRAGRGAASHEIHLDTDANAVADGTALIDTTANASYALSSLAMSTTYYWRIDEVNNAEAITTWEGDVWNFTTETYTVVENFESYTDDEGGRVYDAWLDGYGIATNGSVVGNDMPPYSEGTIVNGGDWSMPFAYSNTGGAAVSEAERTFMPAQDWTRGSPKTLVVNFYGAAGNTGQLYLKINGTKVPYGGVAADLSQAQWQQFQVDLSAVAANLQSVTKLVIGVEGAGAAGTLYFDDVRLYPDAIELIAPVQPDPAGLVLRYSFDEGSGTTARDTSGAGNNGTLTGNPQWVPGAVGSALAFDGVADYVTAGASLLNDAPAFTIAFWVNADMYSVADRAGLVGQNDCIEYGVTPAGTVQIWTPNGGLINFEWPYQGETTEWHQLVAVGDGTSLAMYLDGKLAGTGGTPLDATDVGYGTSTSFLNIGGGGVMDSTGNFFAGQIDEVHVYRRALSPAEVAGLAGRTQPIPKPL